MEKMHWGKGITPSYFWVKNMPGDTFGDSLSRQFYLAWKMDTASGANNGELHRYKTANLSPSSFVDTSMSYNLLPNTSSNGTLGYVQMETSNNTLLSNQHIKGLLNFSVPESSATRVILRFGGRNMQYTTASCSLMTQWTIYPTGQVFRYDSIYGTTAQIDSILFRFNQHYSSSAVNFSNKAKGRSGIGSGQTISDMALAFLSMRDNTGLVSAPFGSAGDTVMLQQQTSFSTGVTFRDKTIWPLANKPYEMAFYMDIQRPHMNALYADSVSNGVQYINPLSMIVGTAVTTSPGDANVDGFNEREGAYIVAANANTVHFKLPARGDTCRFFPAFRITGYSAGITPAHVAIDSLDLIEGVDYNAFVNVPANELVIQFGIVARTTVDVYISATTPIENYSTWPLHTDFVLNTKPLGITSNVLGFPVLIRLSPGSFNGFANTMEGGDDIRFARPDGKHLQYEIERWVDVSGDHDTAEIWVKADTVRQNDSLQYIRMYYGKSGVGSRSNGKGVFNELNAFSGVYHFPAGLDSMNDASGRNPATNKGSVQAPGQIGKARSFNGATQYVNLGNGPLLNPPTMTIAAWVNASSFPISFNTICARGNMPAYQLYVNNSAQPSAKVYTGAVQTANDAGTIPNSAWHQLVLAYEGSMLRLYRDGVQAASMTASGAISQLPADSTFIGKGFSGQYWTGLLDEVRISATGRSADWIKLCYENQKANQMLVAIPPGNITWVGGVNAQWSNPANWSPSRVPTNNDTARFNAGAAACSLSVNDTVAAVVFESGYAGTFTFVRNSLSSFSRADFGSGGSFFADSGDTVRFIGSQTHAFIPKSGECLPVVSQAGSGLTTIGTNPLKAAGLEIKMGTLSLGSVGPDSVGFIATTGGTIDFSGQTIRVSGSAMLSGLSGLNENGGAIEFTRSSGNQSFIPMPGTLHPAVSHTGNSALQLGGTLRATAFSHSAGSLDLNGMDIDTVVNDLSITNGSVIVNLGGRTIEAGGNVTLAGQPGNLLNLAPGATWNLKAGGTLTAGFAVIGNCAAAGTAGTATNSYDLGGNSNWGSITGNPRVEPGPSNLALGGGYFTNKDSIPLMHLRMLTSQAEGVYIDTLLAKMTKGYMGSINYMRLFADIDRNGSFNPPTDTWIKDITVTAADSSICFTRGVGLHLDSLDSKDTSEYWLVMDLNGATLSSTDTFMFSITPSLSRFSGRASYLGVNGGGSMFEGDTAWGMQGGLTLDVGDSNGVIGKPALTDQDSIPCMHFSLTATSVEKVFLDTVRVRMVKGNRLAIDKLSLFRDDGANGSYEPALDSLVWETTVAADSVATFWKTGGFDSVAVSETKRYWLMLHLNSYTVGTADSFRFSLNADSMVVHGASSYAGFPVSGGMILGDTVPGDEAPWVTEVTASTASGSYGIGATVGISVDFSENVTVAGGPPFLTLETGSTDRDAIYSSGSGTTSLTFSYTVMTGDVSADLDYVSGTSLILSGATIKDVNGHDASVILPTPGAAGSLSNARDIRIDGNRPSVPSTSIIAPNGGEVWQGGSNQNITLNNAGITDDLLKGNPINLYYSTDGGATFPNLITADQTNSGTYSWTLPGIDNATVRVLLQVIDSAGNVAFDSSDANFLIDNAAPTVANSALTSPNGGEVWGAGTSHGITWNTGDISDAKLKNNPISLYYSTDNGTTFPNLIASDLANSGTYLWTVASENSASIRVRITVTDSIGNVSHDTSGGPFTIDNAAPTVASTCLTSPNGGEVWASGTSHSITWNTGDISDVALMNNPVSLYYSTDNGSTYPNLIVSDLTNSGSYSWTVASENSGSIRVRIVVSDSLGNTMNDASDASFTIDNVAPSVASSCLTSPNGGEVWASGTSHSITWNTGDISDVMLKNNPVSLYFSTDNGTTFPNLIAADLSNTGSYLWTVASENSSSVRVRISVTDSAGNVSHDVSAACFTIDNGPPSVSSVNSSKSDGIYGIDSIIPIVVHFNENVTVASGTPTIELSTGAAVNYSSGSGTQDLIFAYTVGSGESSADLDYNSSTALFLNGATIRDGAGNDAGIALPAPGASGSLAYSRDLRIDGIAPVISGIGPAASSVINHTRVTFSLSEAIKSGKVTWSRIAGANDVDAPHIQALTGTELAAGTKSNITLTNAPTLVDGSVYTIGFDAVDSAGNPATTVTTTGITFDNAAPIPGTLVITDNNGFTNDPQPDCAISATGADSMAFKLDAGTWSVYEPYAASKTNFSISSGGEGVRTVYVKFKDIAGNETDGLLSDQTTYDVTAPGSGSLVINDSNRKTNNVALFLAVSATGADSMHFRLNGGSWSAWEPYAGIKTGYVISAGGEGIKIIDVMFADRAGNLTAVFSDSTLYDSTPPANVTGLVATAFGGNRIALAWTPSVSGDADSIMIRYSTSAYPADTGSGVWWKRTGAVKMTDTITGLTANTLYYAGLFVRDSAGNWSAASQGSRDTGYVSVNPPGPLSFGRTAVICTVGVAILSDTCVNNGAPADSFVITPELPIGLIFDKTSGRISGTPVVAYALTPHVITAINAGGAAVCTVAVAVSYQRMVAGFTATPLSGAAPLSVGFTDTSKGIVLSRRWSFGDGGSDTAASVFHVYGGAGLYTVSLAVTGPGGSDSLVKASLIAVADTTPPRNTLQVAMSSINDTALAAIIKVDSAQRDVRELWWVFRYKTALTVFDTVMLVKNGYHDTVISLPLVKTAGVWYCTTWLRDSAGNRSSARIDSAKVANKKPVIRPLPGMTIKEDTLWQGRVIAEDWNDDTLRFSFAQAPAGATIDSASGVISWTPTDAAVGVHTLVVRCSDGMQNGTAFDTVMVIVQNVNEPPAIVFAGDSVVFEDSAYTGALRVSDPDPDDSLTFTLLRLPPWMTLARDTLRGMPGNEHVGYDTIHVTVTDRSGLRTALNRAIRVLNTNDRPIIKRIDKPVKAREDSTVTITVTAIDVDAGDSLCMVWQKQPSWFKDGAVAYDAGSGEWRFTLNGKPGANDTGMAYFVFRITDRDGAAALISDSIYVVDLPNSRIVAKQVAFGAARYVLSAGTPADSGLTFAVKLVSLADRSVIERTIHSAGIVEFFPLADGAYAFSEYAIDGRGVREAGVLADTLVIAGATAHIFTGDSMQWSMVGIPARAYPADPVRGSGSLVTWDESGIERDIYGFYIPSKEISEMTGGKSYWRRSRDTCTVSIGPSQLVGSRAAIPLYRSKYGWNQVANPYIFPVRWTRNSKLWKWSGNDYELCGDMLEPWQGYWVMAESTDVVSLEPAPCYGDSGRASKSAAAYFSGKNEWRFRLLLEGRNVLDRENTFGISHTASDGYDAADLFEPPRMQGAGYIFFPHAEWKRGSGEFASDIRKSAGAMTIFQVGIAPWEGNDSAAIRIEGYDPDASRYIFVKSASGLAEYDREKGIALPPSNTTRYITLFVAADRSLARQLPLSFVCGNPYPNPCRSGNRIRYTLPYQWRKDGLLVADNYIVKIMIYDLAGRKVRDLAHRRQEVGAYSVLWDGKMNTGRMVGAGAYLLVLQAGDLTAMRKITVLR